MKKGKCFSLVEMCLYAHKSICSSNEVYSQAYYTF